MLFIWLRSKSFQLLRSGFWVVISIGILVSVSPAVLADEALSYPLIAADVRKQGLVFERGLSVQKNQSQAFRMYCLAAGLGESQAYYDLGWMRFNGRGIDLDQGIAMGWFKVAADHGSQQAQNMLTRFDQVLPTDDQVCPAALASDWSRVRITRWINLLAPLYQLDPELVIAVVEQESAFNPRALSPRNAQGLMQLIPQTATRFEVVDVWHPLRNLLAGMRYLQWLLVMFEGNVANVLAAYNAGEKAVMLYHGIPPYQETQNYVKRIMSRYKKYQHPFPSK